MLLLCGRRGHWHRALGERDESKVRRQRSVELADMGASHGEERARVRGVQDLDPVSFQDDLVILSRSARTEQTFELAGERPSRAGHRLVHACGLDMEQRLVVVQTVLWHAVDAAVLVDAIGRRERATISRLRARGRRDMGLGVRRNEHTARVCTSTGASGKQDQSGRVHRGWKIRRVPACGLPL